MEIKASAKYLRISPRKVRELTRDWKGVPAEVILTRLEAYPQKGSEYLQKLVKQAIANAKNNFKLDEILRVKRIEVSEGPGFKRMDRSHGARFDRGVIKKRTSHLFLTLETKESPKAVVSDVPKIVEKPVEKIVKKINVKGKKKEVEAKNGKES